MRKLPSLDRRFALTAIDNRVFRCLPRLVSLELSHIRGGVVGASEEGQETDAGGRSKMQAWLGGATYGMSISSGCGPILESTSPHPPDNLRLLFALA